MTIGLLGGTFNPIHIGHLVLAQEAFVQLKCDRIYFIVAHTPVHKRSKVLADPAQRLEMVKLAIKGEKNFYSSDVEIKREGKSYSIDTVNTFRKKFPNTTKFYFILGEDNHKTLHTWKDIDLLKKRVSFVAANRPANKKGQAKIKVRSIGMPKLDISSSLIRQMIKAGKWPRYFVPDNVLSYIKRSKLYT